ncbi:hypothetical protein [Variovorax sp. V15]|uniref:hypothetical protein n=1 Tax=Variovorax sp. V15 TaxID=3065952 RepID=UPI0034E881D6
MSMKPINFFYLTLAAGLIHAVFLVPANGQVPTPGGTACEADWANRSRFETMGSLVELRNLEGFAKRGDIGAQLRLGLVRRTRDGNWSAPEDQSYSIQWLEKAQTQGSKSAAWELAQIKRRQISHEFYLRSAIAAAEVEGNPWAATELMNLTNGRWGGARPTACVEEWTADGKCADEAVLPASTSRKWAEIAAEGGNAAAQEWLCKAAAEGNLDRGQPRDDKAAFKWCQIAMHNACADSSLGTLQLLYAGGRGVEQSQGEADRIRKIRAQPWRSRVSQFFSQPY